MSGLTDTEVADLIYDDQQTYDALGTPTSQETREFRAAAISNIREFERRYPADIATAAVNFQTSLVAAAAPPPPPAPPPPFTPGGPAVPGPIGGGGVGEFDDPGYDQPPSDTPPGASRAIP